MPGRLVFFTALIVVALPWSSAPLALAVGIAVGLTTGNPYLKESRTASKILLQTCVVGLGFAMNLHEVVRAGTSGFIYTLGGIIFTLAIGVALGRTLRVGGNETLLISVGTAICGGSAIAAVGPAIGAREEQMSVSLGTVFVLNAVALLTFPAIGWALKLSEAQFGLWSALAIHDTSSVVGASSRYGASALAIGTTVKLARALWIVPLTLVAAGMTRRRGTTIQWPWFIAFFLLAALLATYVPAGKELYAVMAGAARIGLAVTLFLIGSSVTRSTLREVGARPLILGVTLWVIVAAATLALIRAGVIGI